MAYSPFRNLWLKLLSLAIAGLLWLIVAGDRVVERVVRLPLEFQNLPAGLEIVTDTPDAIEVRLRGPSGALGGITPVDAWTVLDLRTARPGRRLYNLTPGQVNVPYGIEVVQVTPAALSLEFENTGVKIVAVKPAIEGRPAEGFEIAHVTAQPAHVEVMGPESALRRLEAATTEPIDVSGATRSLNETVTVGVLDPWLRLRAPQVATVSVHVADAGAERSFSDVQVLARGAASGLSVRITPAVVSLKVRGPQAALRSLRPEDIEAFVDASGLAAGEHTVKVDVTLPPECSASAIEPESVTVALRGKAER